MENLEKMITVHIMQEDAETIFSLMKTERDPIFAMEIIPYYALFIQSCQEYMGETFIEGTSAVKVKDIRNLNIWRKFWKIKEKNRIGRY